MNKFISFTPHTENRDCNKRALIVVIVKMV